MAASRPIRAPMGCPGAAIASWRPVAASLGPQVIRRCGARPGGGFSWPWSVLGHGLGSERPCPCQAARMDGPIKLHTERDLLETRLLLLAGAIDEQRQHGPAAPELVKRVDELLARLGPVNAKLAELRGPEASA